MTGKTKVFEAIGRAAVGIILCSALALVIMLFSSSGVKSVYIFDGGQALNEKPIRTSDGDWREVIENGGTELADADAVDAVVIGNRADLYITRAFDVTIKTKLRERTLAITPMTVGELLERERIVLGEYDAVSPSPDVLLTNEVTVVVTRVSYLLQERVEEVNGERVTRESPLVTEGNTVVATTAVLDGVAHRTYLNKYVDGELEKSVIIREDYEPHPQNAVTLLGKPDAVVSTLGEEFGTELDEGIPKEYERVIEDAVCTAYSFEPGVYGSSGLHLYPGFVAVDPDKIPLGSLLYIADAESGFTYGFAVAADYCEAAAWGIVDVDLFFETYEESLLFGKRRLDVYVIKQLYADELTRYVSNEGMFELRIPARQGGE